MIFSFLGWTEQEGGLMHALRSREGSTVVAREDDKKAKTNASLQVTGKRI